MDTSRYDQANITWAPHPKGGWVRIVYRDPTMWASQTYDVALSNSGGDMLSMAHNRLGDARRYWAIADMNPSVVCPDDLAWGVEVRVPVRGR